MRYIHELKTWPHFTWDDSAIANILSEASFAQGEILGRMQGIGFDLRQEAVLDALSYEITKSSEIEGEKLDLLQVRSSIARRLNIKCDTTSASSHHVDGIVEMMIDATSNSGKPLSLERLCGWHAALFPTGYSGLYKINVAQLRDDKDGPMQVVSSKAGRDIVYFEAPAADRLPHEIEAFIRWINNDNDLNPLIKAAISHLWFITLHPFEDGNGRIARAITEMMLSRAEKTPFRFYSTSAQIQKEKNSYYEILEATQKGNLDITKWLIWFMQTLQCAIRNSKDQIGRIIHKAQIWQRIRHIPLDEKQCKILNMLLDGFKGNLTSSKMAKICKCSQDTAARSLKYLAEQKILKQEGQGRSTHYVIFEQYDQNSPPVT